jgi:hypothetical protein
MKLRKGLWTESKKRLPARLCTVSLGQVLSSSVENPENSL